MKYTPIPEWALPTPKPSQAEVPPQRPRTDEEILFAVPFEARVLLRELNSKNYSTPEILLILAKAYGEMLGGAKSFRIIATDGSIDNTIQIEQLERQFFELCMKERIHKQLLIEKVASDRKMN